jgi:hypothetical protein
MGVTHGHLKTLMHGSERYHEIRWNVTIPSFKSCDTTIDSGVYPCQCPAIPLP